MRLAQRLLLGSLLVIGVILAIVILALISTIKSLIIICPPNRVAVISGRSRQLSDGRTLDLALEFGSPWPTVQLIYHDPAFATPDASPVDEGGREGLLVAGPRPASVAGDEGGRPAEPGALRGEPFRRLLAPFARRFWLLRPGFVSAFVALALVAALLFVRMSVPAVSAAELLDRTLAAEEQAAAEVGAGRALGDAGAPGDLDRIAHAVKVFGNSGISVI